MSTLVKASELFPSSFFSDFFAKDFFDWNDKNFSDMGSTLPSVNVKETDTEFKIEMAAPGLKKSDFKIELNNGVLSISSEKKEEKEEKNDKEKYTRKEYSYKSFCRTFRLPEIASDEKIDANYNDGILHISIAKKQIASPKDSKKIAVN